jgi:hypothetical protein
MMRMRIFFLLLSGFGLLRASALIHISLGRRRRRINVSYGITGNGLRGENRRSEHSARRKKKLEANGTEHPSNVCTEDLCPDNDFVSPLPPPLSAVVLRLFDSRRRFFFLLLKLLMELRLTLTDHEMNGD